MKKPLKLPKFKNEDEEREYWSKVDLSEYYENSDLTRTDFANLKATSQPISIRLPQHLLARIKHKAHSLDVPYQALIKMYLADRLREDSSDRYKV